MYNQKVIECFNKTENLGEIRGANAVGSAGNVGLGDFIRLYLKIENEEVIEAKSKTFGCVVAIAISALGVDHLKGLNIDELIAFDPEIILQEIGEIPEEQKKYVYFFKDAVLDAVKNYNKRLERENRE